MNAHTQQALLRLKGMARTMREEAAEARAQDAQIQPQALEQYAAMLDNARETLEAQGGAQ